MMTPDLLWEYGLVVIMLIVIVLFILGWFGMFDK